MILNILTAVSCLLILFFFRRLDRSNLRMIKLKRYSSKIFGDFRKLADSEGRRFNDATIEMDLLIKKAGSLSTTLRESIIEIENRLKGLDIEKTSLKKVEDDLKIVSRAAQEVNKQVEFIASSRNSFNDITKKISTLTEGCARLERETALIVQGFNEKMRERSRELGEEVASQITKLKDSIKEKEASLVNNSQEKVALLTATFSESLMKMEQRITTTGDAILENVRDKLESVNHLTEMLENRIEGAEQKVFTDINGKIGALEKEIGDFDSQLGNAREQALSQTREDITGLAGKLSALKTALSDLENNAFSDIKERASDIRREVSDSLAEFYNTRDSLFSKVDTDIEKVYGKLRNVESTVDESKDKLIAAFEDEVRKIRTELDNLNIHSISKKDEIVKAARREAEEVRTKIEEFSDRYSELEVKLSETAESKVAALLSEYHSVENRFNTLSEKLLSMEDQFSSSLSNQMDRVKNEFSLMDQRLGDIRKEIVTFEEDKKIFSKSDEMIKKVEDSIQSFTAILRESKEEARGLQKFIDDVERIKDLKKSVEKEIKAFDARKSKLINFENEITGLIELTDLVTAKADQLEEKLTKIDQVNSRIDALAEGYTGLESRIAELHQYEDTIAKNLESIQKSDLIIKTIEGKIQAFNNTVDRSDKRIQKLTQYLHSIEESTLVLKSREQEIRDVKDKFGELEGLSAHLEKRVDQLHAMFQKIETMRSEIDHTDMQLKEMFTQTDLKMKQFADFLHAVESSSPIAKQLKADLLPGKNINEGIIKTVRELSNKGWSSGEISKKLLIDEHAVRLIINTTSL